jgi:hypothetical protein
MRGVRWHAQLAGMLWGYICFGGGGGAGGQQQQYRVEEGWVLLGCGILGIAAVGEGGGSSGGRGMAAWMASPFAGRGGG